MIPHNDDDRVVKKVLLAAPGNERGRLAVGAGDHVGGLLWVVVAAQTADIAVDMVGIGSQHREIERLARRCQPQQLLARDG